MTPDTDPSTPVLPPVRSVLLRWPLPAYAVPSEMELPKLFCGVDLRI